MRLCMFHPNGRPLERGWVGRVDGDRVVHLAAQTLQSFFLGGGGAREHAEYALGAVTFVVPVLHPPTVRLFDGQETFAFANAAAVTGPGATIAGPARTLDLLPRVAAVIGADEQIGGFAALAEWRAAGVPAPKDRDFALVLGPFVVTPDELPGADVELSVRAGGGERLRTVSAGFDWEAARVLARAGTTLRPGDILAGPAAGRVEGLSGPVELEAAGIGVLRQTVA